MRAVLRSAGLVLFGVAIGGSLVAHWDSRFSPAATVSGQGVSKPAPEPGTLQADVAYLQDVRPSQSHTMMDVGYHWTNMWFAAEKRNWPLARFYFNESRQHIRWTIKVRPIRKDPDGRPVDLKAIFDALDTTSMEGVKQAIEKKDHPAFVAAYKQMLEGCYSCHKANGLLFLRPAVPHAGMQAAIINLDPAAKWPE
jgi:hypothetical protein